jgi:hypothetical protein
MFFGGTKWSAVKHGIDVIQPSFAALTGIVVGHLPGNNRPVPAATLLHNFGEPGIFHQCEFAFESSRPRRSSM